MMVIVVSTTCEQLFHSYFHSLSLVVAYEYKNSNIPFSCYQNHCSIYNKSFLRRCFVKQSVMSLDRRHLKCMLQGTTELI